MGSSLHPVPSGLLSDSKFPLLSLVLPGIQEEERDDGKKKGMRGQVRIENKKYRECSS